MLPAALVKPGTDTEVGPTSLSVSATKADGEETEVKAERVTSVDVTTVEASIEVTPPILTEVADTAAVSVMPRSAIVHAEPLEEMKFLVNVAHQIRPSKSFLDRKASRVMDILEQMERRDRGFQEVLE